MKNSEIALSKEAEQLQKTESILKQKVNKQSEIAQKQTLTNGTRKRAATQILGYAPIAAHLPLFLVAAFHVTGGNLHGGSLITGPTRSAD